MSKTMTANIPGARLRDVERRLAMLRGEEAINAFLAEHPNEVRILEQMVEWRRSGRPVPSLTRVQRVMLWSDGDMEFKTDPAPEVRGRPGGPSGPGARRDQGQQRGGGGPSRGPGGPRGPRAGQGAPGAQAAQGGFGQRGPSSGGFGQRGQGPGGFGQGGGARGGGPSSGGGGGSWGGTSRAGGPPRGGRPAGGRGRRGDEYEGGSRGVPRSGEGWVLLREGESPPPDPDKEPLWDDEDAAEMAEATPATEEAEVTRPAEVQAATAEPMAQRAAGHDQEVGQESETPAGDAAGAEPGRATA